MQKSAPDPSRLRRAPRTGLLAAFAALTLLLAGCAYPKPIRTYEFVVQYDRMTDRFDPLVSLVYVPHPKALSQYQNVAIGQVEPAKSCAGRSEMAERYGTFFRHVLHKELVRSGRFTFVTLDPEAEFPAPALRVEGAVTRLGMGSGVLRYLDGLFHIFPWAASDFQVEGRLVDSRSGALVMEFVDQRRHLGNTCWGPNPHTFNGDFVMKVTVKETAECLGKFIARLHAGMPPD